MTAAQAGAAERQAPGGADPLACPSADARGPRSHGRRDSGAAAPPQVSASGPAPDSSGSQEEGWSWARGLCSSGPRLLGGRCGEERGEATDGLMTSGKVTEFNLDAREEWRQGTGFQTKGAGAGCCKWFVFKLPTHELSLSAVPGNLNLDKLQEIFPFPCVPGSPYLRFWGGGAFIE